jgi:hypothetical protein
MSSQPAKERSAPVAPWGWSGVSEKLQIRLPRADLLPLVPRMPRKNLPVEVLFAALSEFAARFLRDLQQDECGPTRADRAAGLKSTIEYLDAVEAAIAQLSSSLRSDLGDELSAIWSPRIFWPNDLIAWHIADKDAIWHLAMAAAEVGRRLRQDGGIEDAAAMGHFATIAYEAAWCVQLLDTTSDSDAILCAKSTDLLSIEYGAEALTDVGDHLRRLRFRLQRAFDILNKIKGPDAQVSFRILVARLCEFWTWVTGHPVTTNPFRKTKYLGRPQTEAGDFVCAAVEVIVSASAGVAKIQGNSTRARALMSAKAGGLREQAVHSAMRAYVAGLRSDLRKSGPADPSPHTM